MTITTWVPLSFALGLAAGVAGTLLAMRPMLARRYQDGKAEMAAAVWRDIGTVEMQRMIQRIAAMDQVQEAMGGKRT